MNTTENPPPGDQGLAFQTHALQMILSGPFTCEPNTATVRHESSPYTIFLLSKKTMNQNFFIIILSHNFNLKFYKMFRVKIMTNKN